MLKEVTLYDIEQVLRQLGFEERKIKGSHIKFIHHDADALILLPLRPKSLKLPHIRMIEKVLEEKGILGREAFETACLEQRRTPV